MSILRRTTAPDEVQLVAELNTMQAELIRIEGEAAAMVGAARGKVSRPRDGLTSTGEARSGRTPGSGVNGPQSCVRRRARRAMQRSSSAFSCWAARVAVRSSRGCGSRVRCCSSRLTRQTPGRCTLRAGFRLATP